MTAVTLTPQLLDELNFLALGDGVDAGAAFTRRLRELAEQTTPAAVTLQVTPFEMVPLMAEEVQAGPRACSFSSKRVALVLDQSEFALTRVHMALELLQECELLGEVDEIGRFDQGGIEQTWPTLQRVLSQLLVANPALMDPRLHFALTAPQLVGAGIAPRGFTSVGCALAAMSCASLPSTAHGIDEHKLSDWAQLPVVRRGLTAVAPDVALDGDSSRLRSAPLLVACQFRAAVPEATRGAFFCSLLELSNHVVERGNPPLIHLTQTDLLPFFNALSRVFIDFCQTGKELGERAGDKSGVAAERFYAALRLRALDTVHVPGYPVAAASGSDLLRAIRIAEVDNFMFGGVGAAGRFGDIKSPADVDAGARAFVTQLAESGLVSPIARAASHTLSLVCGEMRKDAPLPACTAEAAYSFLQALHDISQEARVEPEVFAARARRDAFSSMGAGGDAGGAQTWMEAASMLQTRVSMKRIIEPVTLVAQTERPDGRGAPGRRRAL